MRNQIILRVYILFNRAVHARATGHQEFSSRALVTIVPIMLLLLGPLFLILVCVGYRVFVKTKKAQAVKWVPSTAPYLPTNINEQFCKTIFLKSINVFFSRLTLSRLRGLSRRHSRQSREGAPNQIGDEELQQQPDDERTNIAQESHQRETEINWQTASGFQSSKFVSSININNFVTLCNN
jgi:hypothetical protein